MKKVVLTVLFLTALTGTAHARVLSVEVDEDRTTPTRNVYVATAEACPGTFQSVVPEVERIGDNEAIVTLEPVLDVKNCRAKVQKVNFFVLIDRDLTGLGLDPRAAKVFFQLQ